MFVSWFPSLDDDVRGYFVYGRTAGSPTGELMTPEAIEATEWSFPLPQGGGDLYLSVSAVDYAGNESDPGPEALMYLQQVRLTGPVPHPIVQEAAFLLKVPSNAAGDVAVVINIYSITGRMVRRLVNESFPAGTDVPLYWDTRNDRGSPVSSGPYFLNVTIAGRTEIRKVVVF